MKLNKALLLSTCAFIPLLSACSEPKALSTPTAEVLKSQFEIRIPGKGEITTAEAHKITSPGRSPLMLSWLAEENTFVKKGDVVARFDAENLLLDQRQEELAMMLLDEDISKRVAEKDKQKNELKSEQAFIGKEYEFADQYAIDDLRLYSKLEIIDTFSNKEYLGAKEDFIGWQQGSLEERSESSLEVLDIQKKGHEAKYQRATDALSKLEVYAPFDGLLVYERNFRGEKPSVGQTVFPGHTIAKIPNLAKLQAKLYVLDKDAIGLSEGQGVRMTLQSDPDVNIRGKVSSVSGFSRSISRGDPVKYFDITVEMEASNIDLKPGMKVEGEIHVDSHADTLMVPLQALFNEEGQSYVYVKNGHNFIRQNISIGKKNLYFAEVTDGLTPGQELALTEVNN